jgi:hypothetical protein
VLHVMEVKAHLEQLIQTDHCMLICGYLAHS